MGRTPNLKFSIERGRELSHFESRIDSIKRRLSKSIPRSRHSGHQSEIVTTESSISPYMMSRKNRQAEFDITEGGSETIGNSNSRGNGSGNTNGLKGGSRHNRESTESQSILNLGPFTLAANETVNSLLATQKAIKSLTDLYTRHVEDIERVPKIHQRLSDLEKQCRFKDEKIKKHKNTIETLKELSREREENVTQETRRIEKERKALEEDKKEAKKDKEISAKRLKAQEAEMKNEQDKEFEKIKANLKKEFKDRMENEKQDIRKQEDEIKKRLSDLEAENHKLSVELQKQKNQNEQLTEELTKAKEDRDDLVIVKDTLKAKLKTMENEFSLNTRTTEFYNEKFVEISKTIEDISVQYFKELNTDKDTNTIHQELQDADIGFASIPISSSEESQKLRIARAQHVISSTLTNVIWQPFSSERTLSHPNLVSLLSDISTELGKPRHGNGFGRRVASVWSALTMRALHSLSPVSPLPATLTSQGTPPHPRRAEEVVVKILSILSPLVIPSQKHRLQTDLLVLANSAISVWSSAQTGELQLMVSPSLEHASRDEWRSLMFDPPPSSSKDITAAAEITSSTHPRIFTLFPRVIASRLSNATEPSTGVPGSWPESEQEPRTIETCIHTGTGLPEWSALVVKGKEEEEWTKECLHDEHLRGEMEKLKRELDARSGRNGGHSRSGSMVGSMSGPSSPIVQWMREGRRKVFDEE